MKNKEKNNTASNHFINLDELLYTPLHAVAKSNTQLGAEMMELISSAGDIDPLDKENTVHLKTLNLAYEQINNDSLGGKVIEEIGLRVPLISMMPISGLQIKKSKIAFDAEIKKVRKNKKTNRYDMESRICSSSKESRKNGLPKLSFEIELENVPVSEGLARFIDILNVNPIPETLSTHQINERGEFLTGKDADEYKEIKALKLQQSRLNIAGEKLASLIAKKKLMFNSMLKECGIDDTFDTMFTGSKVQNDNILSKMSQVSSKPDKMSDLYEKIFQDMNTYDEIMRKSAKIESKRIHSELKYMGVIDNE